MAQFSIGICTPIPLLPIDTQAVRVDKAEQAKNLLAADPTAGSAAFTLLEEAFAPMPEDGERHLGLITPEWHKARKALVQPMGHSCIDLHAEGKEIGAARQFAVEEARRGKLKYLFFLDWDVLVPPDALIRLAYILDNNPEVGVASGMYSLKCIPPYPMLWKEWNQGVFWDWTMGDMIKGVVGCPMGVALLRLSLFDDLPTSADNPWFKTTDKSIEVDGKWRKILRTEDLHFTDRYTTEAKGQIWVDTSLYCNHICHRTGRQYKLGEDSLPMKRWREKQEAAR